MKKLLTVCCLLSAFVVTSAFADVRSDLQARLDKVNTLEADFTQTVYAADGVKIQSGQGKLWLKRPSLFRWHMTEPDESILVSDGKTLWFYNPFVEQVTITRLKEVTEDTPFMLISRNNAADWGNYSIMQTGDKFELTPKPNKASLKPFTINVKKNGQIDSFVAKELDGQHSTYVLTKQSTASIDVAQFTFIPPKGVTIDDQR